MYNLKKIKTINKQAQEINGNQYDNVTKQFLIANTGLFVISGMTERVITDINNIINDVINDRLKPEEMEKLLTNIKIDIMGIKANADETRERTKELS